MSWDASEPVYGVQFDTCRACVLLSVLFRFTVSVSVSCVDAANKLINVGVPLQAQYMTFTKCCS